MTDTVAIDKDALVRAIEENLSAGVRHRSRSGRLLLSAREVVDCLLAEGIVILDPPAEGRELN